MTDIELEPLRLLREAFLEVRSRGVGARELAWFYEVQGLLVQFCGGCLHHQADHANLTTSLLANDALPCTIHECECMEFWPATFLSYAEAAAV